MKRKMLILYRLWTGVGNVKVIEARQRRARVPPKMLHNQPETQAAGVKCCVHLGPTGGGLTAVNAVPVIKQLLKVTPPAGLVHSILTACLHTRCASRSGHALTVVTDRSKRQSIDCSLFLMIPVHYQRLPRK